MRKSPAIAVAAALVLAVPAGCTATLAVGAAAISAATAPSPCSDVASSVLPTGTPTPLLGVGDSCPPAAGTPPGFEVDPLTIHAPDALAAQAVAAALTAVSRGGRYIAEGNGPVNFDCSGLTAWAWRQAEINTTNRYYARAMDERSQDPARAKLRMDLGLTLEERIDALWIAWTEAYPDLTAGLFDPDRDE